MNDAIWPREWLRGVLPLCTLAIIESDEETYGYAITQRLKGAGLGVIKGGTLYPILARLESDGLITSTWRGGDTGPGRRYVAITEAGREYLVEQAARWRQLSRHAEGLLVTATPCREQLDISKETP